MIPYLCASLKRCIQSLWNSHTSQIIAFTRYKWSKIFLKIVSHEQRTTVQFSRHMNDSLAFRRRGTTYTLSYVRSGHPLRWEVAPNFDIHVWFVCRLRSACNIHSYDQNTLSCPNTLSQTKVKCIIFVLLNLGICKISNWFIAFETFYKAPIAEKYPTRSKLLSKYVRTAFHKLEKY